MTPIDLFLIHGDLPLLVREHGERWIADLGSEDRQRLEIFRHEGARAQFLIGRVLMRDALVTKGYDWSAVDRSSEKYRHPDVCFNLSHVDGLVALAVDAKEVGLDVEYVGRNTNRTQLMPRQFVASEIAWVDASADDAEHRNRFFTLWTIKEALLKAEACGLRVDTRKIVVDPEQNTVSTSGFGDGLTFWDFYSAQLGDHPVCIATPTGEHREVRVYQGIPGDWTQIVELNWRLWKAKPNAG